MKGSDLDCKIARVYSEKERRKVISSHLYREKERVYFWSLLRLHL